MFRKHHAPIQQKLRTGIPCCGTVWNQSVGRGIVGETEPRLVGGRSHKVGVLDSSEEPKSLSTLPHLDTHCLGEKLSDKHAAIAPLPSFSRRQRCWSRKFSERIRLEFAINIRSFGQRYDNFRLLYRPDSCGRSPAISETKRKRLPLQSRKIYEDPCSLKVDHRCRTLRSESIPGFSPSLFFFRCHNFHELQTS